MSAQSDVQAAAQPTAPAGQDRPVQRRVLVFVTISLALMMMAIDSTIVATALHSLQHELNASVNWAGWTITAYSFGFVLMLPISGKLSGQYGRRKVFLGSVILFTTASLLCGMAGNIYELVALRALQAAGGAGFTPSATGIVVDYFGKERDRAVSLFGSIFPIGAMIGPIFGGLFVTYWTWRGIFFVNVPIGVAVIVLTLRYIPRDLPKPSGSRTKTDLTGMALLGAGVLAGMLAISYLGEPDASVWSPFFTAPLALALATLWAFIRHIERSKRPYIAPHLIFGSGFGVVNLINAIYGGVRSGVVALIPLYATNRYGLDALSSGTLLIAQGVATIVLSITAALMIRRTGYRMPLYVGGTVVAIGVLLLAVSPVAGISPYTWRAGAALLVGAGGGAL
ncbi:MAG TPA: MFS transporter, partial [Paralcaligenes sp.]